MKPLRILAIEDDEVDLMSLKRALREIKLANPVEHAVDGVEGWKFLFDDDDKPLEDYPEIVLLDLNMPRMGGHDFLKKLHQVDDCPPCKIFVMTTSDSDQDIVGAHEFGIEGYLLKSDLVDSLREAFADLDHKWALVV